MTISDIKILTLKRNNNPRQYRDCPRDVRAFQFFPSHLWIWCSHNGGPPVIISLYLWYQVYFVIIIVEFFVIILSITCFKNIFWGWTVPLIVLFHWTYRAMHPCQTFVLLHCWHHKLLLIILGWGNGKDEEKKAPSSQTGTSSSQGSPAAAGVVVEKSQGQGPPPGSSTATTQGRVTSLLGQPSQPAHTSQLKVTYG